MADQPVHSRDPLSELDTRVSAVQGRLANLKSRFYLMEHAQLHTEMGAIMHDLVDIRATISEARCERAGLRMQLRQLKEDSHG